MRQRGCCQIKQDKAQIAIQRLHKSLYSYREGVVNVNVFSGEVSREHYVFRY